MAILKNWEESPNISITKLRKNLSLPNNEKDFMKIVATKINLANVIDYDQFSNFTQFDVKKPKTHAKTMQGLYIAEWA